jgi:exodeoxyribonuclease VII small subunit
MATTQGNDHGEVGVEAPVTEVGELTYSSAGAELDAIIEEFETGVIDVDRLVDQLERATEIVDELDRRLRRTRMRVEELVPRLEAIGRDDPSGQVDDPFSEAIDEEDDIGSEELITGDADQASPGLF